jgi:hypothetical protein
LQPEHDAQQSADEQQVLCAAFAVPATPSAITAINSITFNVFIVFSFKSGKSFSGADESSTGGNPKQWSFTILLNAEDVYFSENISTCAAKRRNARIRSLENKLGCIELEYPQRGNADGDQRSRRHALLLRQGRFCRTTGLGLMIIFFRATWRIMAVLAAFIASPAFDGWANFPTCLRRRAAVRGGRSGHLRRASQ